MKILTIPMKVDAMVDDKPMTCLTTLDDFARLPYFSKQQIDINYDVANLASSIARKPYSNYVSLPKGVHLHWTLPDAMKAGEANDEGIDMPHLPNRYMVKRIHKTDGSKDKIWIVESDYLYPEGVEPQYAVCIPNLDVNKRALIPYRYLGRQLPLDEWLEEQQDNTLSHEYLPKLDALGWGTPYFSALYPDCFSVFGAYDEDVVGEEARHYEYLVYGWYSDRNQDFIVQKLSNSDDGDSLSSRAQSVANWQIADASAANADMSVCYAKVSFAEDMSLSDGVDTSDTQLTLAKSSEECVAAFLAEQCAGSDKALAVKYENQLQALFYTDDIQGENVDFVNRLKNVRHKEEFDGVTSGDLWTFIDDASFIDSQISDEQQPILLAEYQGFKSSHQQDLSQLNQRQEDAHKTQLNVEYWQRVLYNEWSKYMLCLHPTDMNSTSYPQSDWLRHKMQSETIPKLKSYSVEFGHQQQLIEEQKSCLEQTYQGFIQSLSAQTEQAEGDFAPELLVAIAGPRYWQPKEPSLLVSGDIAVSNREATSTDDEGLPCHLLDVVQADFLSYLTSQVDSELNWQQHAQLQWRQKSWKPLFMEYKAAIYPERTALAGQEEAYPADFVRNTYRIPLNNDEFALPGSGVDLRLRQADTLPELDSQANVVNGRTLLSYSAKASLLKNMRDYLQSEKEDSELDLTTDPSYQAIAVLYEKLTQTPCVLQALSGLHDELLMYSDLTLLKVNDPARFSQTPQFDANITDQVSALLDGHSFKLPAFGHRFTPIKNGVSHLQALRIVDSFGRYKPVDTGHLLRPQRQQRDAVQGQHAGVYSPPRVLQPMRLKFRWQEQLDIDTQQYTPICGYLCYNVFDETLALYNGAGALQGQINPDGEWQGRRGKLKPLDAISHPILRSFTHTLLSFHSANRSDDGNGVNYLPLLKKAIMRAQENIEPQTASAANTTGVLKPLAIVQTSLDLELMGPAETDKNWHALTNELEDGLANSRQFTQVKFPIKLGEYNNLDDGLVAYWKWHNGEVSGAGSFPQSDMADVEGFIDAASFAQNEADYIDQSPDEGIANIEQCLDDPALSLILLMDPEAKVHATTGIVPRKSLQLANHLFQEVVDNIQTDYFTAPLLSPVSQLTIDLPEEQSWCWTQVNPQGEEQNQLNGQVVDKGLFLSGGGDEAMWQACVNTGVLSATEFYAAFAYLDLGRADALTSENLDTEFLIGLLQASTKPGIQDTVNGELFGDRVKAIEGWLERFND